MIKPKKTINIDSQNIVLFLIAICFFCFNLFDVSIFVYNGLKLTEGSEFTTNVDAENQFDYPQMRLRSTEPPICQTRVSCSYFL